MITNTNTDKIDKEDNNVIIVDKTKYLQDGIVVIKLNREKNARNAVDRETADRLSMAFREFDGDDRFKVAILYGGDKVFCAGADLKKISLGDESQMNRLQADGDAPMGCTRMLLGKPVITGISGYCVAGGLELALWSDLRVASRDAIFGVFCRRWGVPLIDGGTVRLPRLVGHSRAMDLILTGRPVTAEEAFNIGLVNRLVDTPNQVLDKCIELAKLIGSFPQNCLRSDRLSVYQQHNLSLNDALSNEFKLGYPSLQKDGVGGSSRFAQGMGRHGKFIESKL
ncbi:Putative enoyl CoA-hydratase [Cavenderia fasciculata]|uniref:Enoyl CoA-hydratase n=1 Tax=Cavenderia fasciculata TaxID=261658 RepID=F4PNP9_CACFS|nr:Putative enoyl CoA-hydratase [Cavenderia fasciculata]EGG23102.1 Putative enoyl CoA-hydratase [Cavenderia fasciculata]|eukprot:XP_004360953.1 Putative enoyl CoA-hydratase [Cavenderia fasciculata]